MMHGDLSNDAPLRVFVHIDVITVRRQASVPFLKFFKRTVEQVFFDKIALAALWRYSVKYEVRLELFATGISQRDMDEVLEELDRIQTHPFHAGTVYPDVHALVSELPYRQDIVGVIDLPQRGLKYGSRWIDLTRIG